MRARLRAGEPAAFGQLFDQHAPAVYKHAFRLTGDWSLAEDVVSEAFLQAWRLRVKIDAEGGSLRPWLLGIATNTARNFVRKARREQSLLRRITQRDVALDFAEELAGRIDDAGRLAAAQAAWRTLRAAEREVFALCVWAGLDYAAAAEALGIPVGTVRSRLSRARRKVLELTDRHLAGRNWDRNWEPRLGRGQVNGSRSRAARPAEEREQ